METMETCLCIKTDEISFEFVCRALINRYQVFPFVIQQVHLLFLRLVALLSALAYENNARYNVYAVCVWRSNNIFSLSCFAFISKH